MSFVLKPTRAGMIYTCQECKREFNNTIQQDMHEVTYGHDCEVN